MCDTKLVSWGEGLTAVLLSVIHQCIFFQNIIYFCLTQFIRVLTLSVFILSSIMPALAVDYHFFFNLYRIYRSTAFEPKATAKLQCNVSKSESYSFLIEMYCQNTTSCRKCTK